MNSTDEGVGRVKVVAYDPMWPNFFAAEQELLNTTVVPRFLELEHIGSTSVPGQRAKPIIDMMAAVESLEGAGNIVAQLEGLRYELIATGMQNRLFLRKRVSDVRSGFQLHIVERATWDDRKERHMRDYLRQHPEAVLAYGALKDHLAAEFSDDSLAYTRAKTHFIQDLIDRARDERGLPRIDVWND
jgi:GrpB-like predicted nucleotidyltransferase (UPF0157 family)